MNENDLVLAARKAAVNAYCPYSNFHVGASVLADGKIYTGCNIENASYGLTICAERTAIFKAISEGVKNIEMLAVSCIDTEPNTSKQDKMPCGACRQVIAEFMDDDKEVIVDGVKTYKVRELIPDAFRLK